ncbi:MAG: hypothetical protein U1F29_12905 [Planctomycetota bacterium]
MKLSRLTPSLLVILAVGLGLVVSLAASARSAQQTNSRDAEPNTGSRPFFGTGISDLGEGADLDINISLLPNAVLADGTMVRPLFVRGIFEIGGGHYLGESRVHRLCPSNSTEAFDLSSAQELDLDLFATSTDNHRLRQYDVRVAPAPGKTWGQVVSMTDDVRITTHRR